MYIQEVGNVTDPPDLRDVRKDPIDFASQDRAIQSYMSSLRTYLNCAGMPRNPAQLRTDSFFEDPIRGDIAAK
jgi:hypothetical protein